MRTLFATRVFQGAGLYGLLLLIPLYGAYLAGVPQMTVSTSHPHFVHGFYLVAIAWQFAFLMIATDPVRYRVLMLAAMLEKFPFTIATLMLYSTGDAEWPVMGAGVIDGLLGLLFAASYVATADSADAE